MAHHGCSLAKAGFLFAFPLVAQAALPVNIPDAGRLLREQQAPVAPPAPGVALPLPPAVSDQVPAGGKTITLREVVFIGNTIYSQEQLRAAVVPVAGKPYDLAGLYALADEVSEFYRARGYGFAKAYLPALGIKDGVLTIQVVEGYYGQRAISIDDLTRADDARAFLAGLDEGKPIYTPALERRLLLLSDQPGYETLPIMSAGKALGTGDLEVKLTRVQPVSGSLSVSNYGSRYTGYYQARANLLWNSPFLLGDQLGFSLLQSDENQRSLGLNYARPLGADGWRATAGYGYTSYSLGREFKALKASGTAQTATLGLSYALQRSQRNNVTLSLSAQHKRLFDEQLAVGVQEHRASNSGSVGLNFNNQDDSGITYGSLELVMGHFDGIQQNPGKVNGRFVRMNADVVRLQRLMGLLSLYARLNGQIAADNLDSSEGFSLGGVYGVRGYPTSEASGDEGYLAQLELRYSMGGLTPYLFFDAGRIAMEHKPTAVGKNTRALSGTGVGLRYQRGPWSIDTLLAKPLSGGKAQSDVRDDSLLFWLIFSYAF